MRIEKDRCDVCDKETDDRYNFKGWIRLDIKELSVSKGRKRDGCAKTNFKSDEEYDFCSAKCFNSFFKELITI